MSTSRMSSSTSTSASDSKIFEIYPKTYTFFYDHIAKKYYIIDGYHNYLPFWHDAYDEETIFNINTTGSVEVHKGKTIRVISRIDGGYSDDEIDYYVTNYADIESENENGLTSKIPNILKLMFDNYKMFKDTLKGTILTEDDFNTYNDYDDY